MRSQFKSITTGAGREPLLDAVQEAFVTIARHRRAPEDFGATLRYTTKLKAIDILRRRKRRRKNIPLDEELCEDVAEPCVADSDKSEQLAHVREAVSKLP